MQMDPGPASGLLLDMDRPVLLFDGVCRFCNASVNFVIDHDQAGAVRFAPLQSGVGQKLLERFGIPNELRSMVLVEGERAFERSEAALRLARRLGGVWRLLAWGVVIPRPIRDALYDWFAAHRYRWFGRAEACRMPDPALNQRFLA